MECGEYIRLSVDSQEEMELFVEILKKNVAKFDSIDEDDFDNLWAESEDGYVFEMDGEPIWEDSANDSDYTDLLKQLAKTGKVESFEASYVFNTGENSSSTVYEYKNKILDIWVEPVFMVYGSSDEIDGVTFFIAGNDYKYLDKKQLKAYIEENGGEVESAEDAEIIIVGDYSKKDKYSDKYCCDEVLSEAEFIFRFWEDEEFAMKVLEDAEANHLGCESHTSISI